MHFPEQCDNFWQMKKVKLRSTAKLDVKNHNWWVAVTRKSVTAGDVKFPTQIYAIGYLLSPLHFYKLGSSGYMHTWINKGCQDPLVEDSHIMGCSAIYPNMLQYIRGKWYWVYAQLKLPNTWHGARKLIVFQIRRITPLDWSWSSVKIGNYHVVEIEVDSMFILVDGYRSVLQSHWVVAKCNISETSWIFSMLADVWIVSSIKFFKICNTRELFRGKKKKIGKSFYQ